MRSVYSALPVLLLFACNEVPRAVTTANTRFRRHARADVGTHVPPGFFDLRPPAECSISECRVWRIPFLSLRLFVVDDSLNNKVMSFG